ncbi:uncharacterized protein KY384_002027 [Bacidia gigantensis]|uniref:uncharacterized protein n=1 Tax=Bacidia gigantensis TaxID=2732470 RepID=UPI001D05299D|nr:uncharacterized protein KY384_002027 [Bacidia gigantensis]KAG8533244.1 hypothetical protein KY384_002027 [Bacidia gigantensis]
MSYYEDGRYDDRRRRKHQDRDPPRYEEEEIIAARRAPKGSGSSRDKAVIPRGDSSDSSVEEVRRDFPPYGSRRDYPPRRAKSARDSKRSGRHDDDYYDDYDDRKHRGSKREKRRRYDSSSSSSPSPRRDRRRKSGAEQALGALGIGGAGGAALASAATALTGRSKSEDRGEKSRRKRRSRRHSDSSSSSSSRSRSRGRHKKNQDPREMLIKAAKAAAIAGGTEAWRMRKEPGDWKGPKGRRVLTAAAGAAGVNGLLGAGDKKGDGGNTIQSVIGGLAGNRLLNGSRKEERSRSRSRGRDRSESRGGGGLGSLAGAGALAAAAAKAFQNRGGSRGRRDYSSSSDDSRYKKGSRRSKSVSEYMRQGMAKIGLGGNEDKRDTTSRGSSRDIGTDAQHLPVSRTVGGEGAGTGHPGLTSSSSDDDISSSEEEREKKKMGRKRLITAGLASVATIHAAHHVYGTMHMQNKLDEDVAEGEISPEKAKKKRNKARMRRAAAVGVAALGVKGAYSEWKEMKEQREEAAEFKQKMQRRRERRLLKQHEHDSTPSTPVSGSIHSVPSDHVPQIYQGRPNGPSVPHQGLHGEYRSNAPDLAAHPNAGYPDGPQIYNDDNPYHTATPNLAPTSIPR